MRTLLIRYDKFACSDLIFDQIEEQLSRSLILEVSSFLLTEDRKNFPDSVHPRLKTEIRSEHCKEVRFAVKIRAPGLSTSGRKP